MRASQATLISTGICALWLGVALSSGGCDRPHQPPVLVPSPAQGTVVPSQGPSSTFAPSGFATATTSGAPPMLTMTAQRTVGSSPTAHLSTPAMPTSPPQVHQPSTTPHPEATAARTPQSVRDCLVSRARAYAGQPTEYRAGGTGPVGFDCTGLVYRVFADCSAAELIGAYGEQPVRAYYDWFSRHGQADALAPNRGDLVIYDHDWTHIAIYIGDGRAISTLMAGVREHDAASLRNTEGIPMPVKAYLHIEVK